MLEKLQNSFIKWIIVYTFRLYFILKYRDTSNFAFLSNESTIFIGSNFIIV